MATLQLYIKDKASLFQFLEKYHTPQKNYIFRGVHNCKYELIPSIGRYKKPNDSKSRWLDEKDEDLIFRFFRQRTKLLLPLGLDELDILAIARHHGLPTRLLDWSFNPLVALYFAIENEITQPLEPERRIINSAIYVLNKRSEAVINKNYKNIRVHRLEYFVPSFIDQRIVNQRCIFTVHPYPWRDPSRYFDEKCLDFVPITIDNDERRYLKRVLNRLGVNQSTIYPDLDGIGTHIKWMKTDAY